jgi:RNA polymerase sigma factor (sigma-70 family)
VEASALELRQGKTPGTGTLIGSLLRLRSDEQLVELFRAGNEDAFCAIHDRYRKRLLAYAARMLNGSGQDAEDALQDVFERAYFGLRAHDRDMALRAWLYRVAHNRCLDQLRRPALTSTIEPDDAESRQLDPVAAAEQRETLRRLVIDIGRLPPQQRSALLLRELSGMSYTTLAVALDVSVPAVKSLLVRARMGLAAAGEARDTACSVIREELVLAHDRGARPGANVRRHLRDCSQCRHFRRSMRSVSRSLGAVTPALGPLGLLVKLLGGGGAAGGGLSGGGGAAIGGSALTGGGGLVAAGGTVGTAGLLSGGLTTGTMGHVAAIVAAALITAGGAVAVRPDAPTVLARPPIHRPAPVSARPSSPPASPSGAVPAAGTAETSAAVPSPAAAASAATRGTAAPGGTGTRSKPDRAAGSSATATTLKPAGSATGPASASAGTGQAASGTTGGGPTGSGQIGSGTTGSGTTGSGTSSSGSGGSGSTSTTGGSSATATGGGTGTSGQSSSGTTPAASSSGSGSTADS